jgi:hypothetical protein
MVCEVVALIGGRDRRGRPDVEALGIVNAEGSPRDWCLARREVGRFCGSRHDRRLAGGMSAVGITGDSAAGPGCCRTFRRSSRRTRGSGQATGPKSAGRRSHGPSTFPGRTPTAANSAATPTRRGRKALRAAGDSRPHRNRVVRCPPSAPVNQLTSKRRTRPYEGRVASNELLGRLPPRGAMLQHGTDGASGGSETRHTTPVLH